MNCARPDVKPAFAERNIPVAISTDSNYLRYVKVLVNSICANTRKGNLDILVLNDGLAQEPVEEFLKDFQGKEGVSVRFLDIGEIARQTVVSTFVQKRYLSVAACYRLLLPDVLTAYDKIAYLDVDTVVCRDLGDLYATDLGDSLFGAAIDTVNSSHKPDYAEWARGYGFTEWDGYVNTGVILLNLAAFREAALLDRLLPIAVDASKWFCDQDALNFVCKGRIKLLDPRWNVQVGDYCIKRQIAITGDEAYVYHFTGSKKPWSNPEHMMAYHWWRHAGGDATALWRGAFGVGGETVSGEGIAVSVVVPVYNAVSYLPEMLVSLSAQTLRNIEIICVDDGSTDGSAAVLSEFAARDPRIKTVSQKNSGGAIARNRGIEEAKGRWLFFADADDFCRPDMLAEMVAEGEATSSDVVVAGRMMVNCRQFGSCSESPVPEPYLRHEQPVCWHTDGVNIFSGIGFAPWNKLYRREFVVQNGVQFHQIPSCDDVFFVFMTLIKAGRIAFFGKSYYYYRAFLATSQMGNVEKHPTNFIAALLEVHDVVASCDVRLQRQYFKATIRSCFENLFTRLTPEGLRKTYSALVGGALKRLEFPAVDPKSVDMGQYGTVYELALKGADLSEILHAYYRPRCATLANDNMILQKERTALAGKVNELRTANETKKQKLGEQEALRVQLSAKVDELRAANEAKRQKLGEQEALRVQLSAKVDELRTANEAKRQKLGEQEALRVQLSAKVDELRAANEVKRQKLGEQEALRVQLSAKVDELRTANEAKKQKLAEQKTACDRLSANVAELRAANAADRHKLGEQKTVRARLSAKVNELRAANDAKKQKLGEQEALRAQLSAKVDELRAANEAKRKKLGEQKEVCSQLSAKVNELRAANEAKKRKLGEQETLLAQRSAKVNELRAANEAKKRKIAELLDQVKTSNNILARLQEICGIG